MLADDDAADRFVHRADIVPEVDSFKLWLAPGSIVSLSTIGGQQKGAVADIPPSKPFPFPYKEDFESYARVVGEIFRRSKRFI